MDRADAIREEVRRRLGQRPFRRFALLMENGERIHIVGAHRIAFAAAEYASDAFEAIPPTGWRSGRFSQVAEIAD